MRNRDGIQLLRAANPVAHEAPTDERGRSDRDQTWRRIRTARQAPLPAAPRSVRSRRSLGIALALLLVVGATVAGAIVVSGQLRDSPTLPAWAGFDSRGATLLGQQEGVAYYRAAGRTPGATCLVRVDGADGLVRGFDCFSAAEFASAGGIVSVQPSGDHYLVAGLLPEGIATARIDGGTAAIDDGFLMTTANDNPGTMVRVYGPGAVEAASKLMPALRSTFEPEGPLGPGYSVLTSPAPRSSTGIP